MTSNTREKTQAANWVLGLMESGEKKGVHALLHDVTPARARALLDQNPDNRSIKPSKIDQYAKDMASNQYEGDNGETIILSKTGELNDGQNRLEAIVKSGLTQKLLIAVGVRRESRRTVDIGANRNAGDYLRMSGDPYGNTTAAAAKRITSFRTNGGFQSTARVSTPEAIALGQNDQRLKDVSTWAHNAAKGFRGLRLAASELATLHYLFDEVATKGQPKQFFNVLGSGIGLQEGSPILALRNKLIRQEKLSFAQKAELLIKAWNSWIRDETNDSFQVNNKIPDIKGPKRGAANS